MLDENAVQSASITSDERIRNVLRRHIRKGLDNNEFTRATLSQESGVNIHQIDGILSRDPAKHRRVACEDALCLAYTLGDEAVNALAGTIRYTAQRQDEPAKLQVGQIVATSLQSFTTIATAAADGRIDYTEAPACRDAADMIIATMLPLSSAGGDA